MSPLTRLGPHSDGYQLGIITLYRMRATLLVFALLLAIVCANNCPPPSVDIGDEECLVPVGINNFYEAQIDCINLGGYLPSVFDDGENEIVQALANKRISCNGVWLGMDDRQFWTDGRNYSYGKWANGTLTDQDTGCVVLNRDSGQWVKRRCDINFAYFCRTSLEVAQTIYPHTGLGYCLNGYSAVGAPSDSYTAVCPTTTVCYKKYDILSIMAIENDDHYSAALSFLDKLTQYCDTKDFGYLINPKTTTDCSFTKMSNNFWTNTGKSFTPSSMNVTGDTSMAMMNRAREHCDSFNSSDGKKALSFYYFTDLSCSELCVEDFPTGVPDFIDDLLARGATMHFIQLLDEAPKDNKCFSTLFAWCTKVTTYNCDVRTVILPMSKDDEEKQRQTLYTCDKDTMSIGLLIALIIVSILSVVGLLGVFYMRWRLKKAGGWREFWKSEAQKGHKHISTKTDEWEIKHGQLTIFEDKQLGSGAFAVVYEGILQGDRPVDTIHPTANLSADLSGKVAVKRLPPHADWFAKKEFLDEIRFMKNLGSHSHILGMIGCQTRADLPLMVLELCELGDLLGYVRAKKYEFTMEETGTFRLKDMISIGWQISDGLSYLKGLSLIHRDLASRNCLLTKNLTVKISDFGLCRMADSSVYISRGGRLPIKWMAIESLKLNSFSHQSDVWSFGVLLWEMFTFGEAPFPSVQPADVLDYLLEGKRLPCPAVCSPKIFKILESCWIEEPELRSDIEAIRSEFSALLHESSVYYGYVALPSMVYRQKLEDLDEEADKQGLDPIGEAEEDRDSLSEGSDCSQEFLCRQRSVTDNYPPGTETVLRISRDLSEVAEEHDEPVCQEVDECLTIVDDYETYAKEEL